MSQNAIIEQVLAAALEKIGRDVGELLGQQLGCSNICCSLMEKSSYFSDLPRGKSILTRLALSGDRDGEACVVLPVAAAAHLGGTLIMLPPDQIEEHARDEILKGEEADAFAEIANILTGSLSQTFQSRYPKKLHLSKGASEDLVPTKVDPATDAPFPPGHYLVCSSDLVLGDKALGPLDLIFPAQVLGLAAPAEEAAAAPAAVAVADSGAQPAAAVAPPPAPAEAAVGSPTAAVEELTAEQMKRNKSLIDLILKSAVQKIDGELGALLGEFVATADLQLQFCTKDSYFFDNPRGTLILSQLSVSGEKEGLAYIATELKEAVFLGGTLIMLPADEIQSQIDQEQFDGEAADAYGEIANILAGVISTAFESKHPKKYHFVRRETQSVVPTKVDVDGPEPFPPGEYYHCSCSLTVGERELDRLDFLFPAPLLGIHSSVAEPPAARTAEPAVERVVATGGAAASPAQSQTVPAQGQAARAGGVATVDATAAQREPVVLVVSNDTEEGGRFQQALQGLERRCLLMNFQDDLKTVFREYRPELVFLVMRQVDEQGFAVAIKLQSAGTPPPALVVGGPQWTRSTVLRAIKYGAQDVLITPTDPAEVVEKAQGALRHQAAS